MALKSPRSGLTIVCFFCMVLLPIQTTVHAEENPLRHENPVVQSVKGSHKTGVEGIATYYARRYDGRRTNSGSRYDPGKMTAAHPSLPLGTKVRVIDLDNKREVVVTVNDRCRRRKVPFIDLSRAAARKLGFLGKNKARVRIIPLD